VLNTRRKQSQLWGDLILAWCRAHKLYELNLADAQTSPLFHNATLNRRLPYAGIVAFVEDLVAAGSAEWVNPKERTKVSILWKNVDHWAAAILNWVVESGKTNTVLTVWEIQNGDDSKDQEFFGLDTRILLKALTALEKQGKAQVFSGTSDENLGVKFFST
jgi:ESCRT-II complex subunit VPS25